MSDRPTFEEFKRSHKHIKKTGYIVKVAEDRYYIVENGALISRASGAVRFVLGASVLAMIAYLFSANGNWMNTFFDQIFYPIIIFHLVSWLFYRFARFRELEQDSSELLAAKKEEFGQPLSQTSFILLGIGLLLLFLNTFTFAYLRSLVYNDAQITSVEVNLVEFDVPDPGTPAVLSVSDPKDDDYTVYITTVRTADKASVTVDGRPQQGWNYTNFFFFWDEDYFKREFFCHIKPTLIHDGSVLTFTCGSLHREWVFRTE